MKNRFLKKTWSLVIAMTLVISSFASASLPVAAATVAQPDSGMVNSIANGGEWSIYSSKSGQITSAGTTINDVTDTKGQLEVTGTSGYAGALQFDLTTMSENEMATDKVVKSASLRLTPMVSKSNAVHTLYTISNDFTSVDNKTAIAEFNVPRGNKDDFFSDEDITALTSDMTEYPEVLANWQTSIDVTGEVLASENLISFCIVSSSDKTAKVEYATSNIAQNGRLNTGKVPLLYDNGETAFSKWIYPQIVLQYTDEEHYRNAYADFIKANQELSNGSINETEGVHISDTENGSTIVMELYGNTSQPAKVVGNSIVFNENYVGNDDTVHVKLMVSNTTGEGETAQYERVVTIPVDYTRSATIAFDTTKNSKGEVTVTSSGKTYTDGTAYAKQGGTFRVNDGANTGYHSKVVVATEDTNEIIKRNEDGTYTMPDKNVKVDISYDKRTYGTTRIAADNSASVRADGTVSGKDSNITIAAGRLTFFRFDLSNYDERFITSAKLSLASEQAYNQVSTAIFYVPNNEWSEVSGLGKEFCILNGDTTTKLNGYNGSVNLFDNSNTYAQVVPELDESMLDKANGEADLSSAQNGILKDYFLTSCNAGLTLDVTTAIQEALKRNADDNQDNGMITLMVYSPRKTGFDIKSVANASELAKRPSLTITESSSVLSDEELITEINTVEDLEQFAEVVSGGKSYSGMTVVLKQDLDLSGKYYDDGESWYPIGTNDTTTGLHAFAGIFEGNQHTIEGLYINESGIAQGLFGAVTGTVQNLNVAGTIKGSSVIGAIAGMSNGHIRNCDSSVQIVAEREAGGIVGTLCNGGVIEYCNNTGNIVIKDKETYAGGIASHNVDGDIRNCFNTGDIINGTDGFRNRLGGIVGYLDHGYVAKSYNTGKVISESDYSVYVADETQNYTGGIAGYSQQGMIENCYNTGDIYNAVDYSGGVVGYLQNNDTVSYCYNTGTITARKHSGGVIGYLSSGTVYRCYYRSDVMQGGIDGIDTSDSAENKTEEEFASGAVTHLLQGIQPEHVWGQALQTSNADGYPLLSENAAKRVYQVRFMNGVNQHALRYANTAGLIELPAPPTLEGNTFKRWVTMAGEEFVTGSPLTDDMTLIAEFVNAGALIPGDVNQDRKVTAVDALICMLHSEMVELERGDMDGNSIIDQNDAELILEIATK